MNDLAPAAQAIRAKRPGTAPTVSVILPTFNRLHFLRSTVTSVVAQTYRDWELLLADDGSDEETRAYLRGLDDSRIRRIWLRHTGNPAVVRNAALRQARGEYVAFIDSDDLWHASKLQLQIDSLVVHPRSKWSLTGIAIIDDSHTARRPLKVVGGWILDRLIAEEATVHVSSVLASRRLVEELGGFDEQFSPCVDYDLSLRMAAHSEADLVDEPLTLVRRHTEHYADDILCLQDLARMLDKVQRSGLAAHIHAVLEWRRAKCAAALARAYAICGQRRHAMTTLSGSLRYSWRHRAWRNGALSTTLRVLLPDAAARMIRRYRGGGPDRSRP